MKLLLVSLLLGSLSFATVAEDREFNENVKDNSVFYENQDGSASASLSILAPIANLSTTKEYAQYVMDSYRGWNLSAVIQHQGFSFRFVDNAPCVGLVTYFDGRSYLFFKACGNIKKDSLKELYKKANEKLKISDILKKQSKTNMY